MMNCPLSGFKFSRSKALLLGAGAAALLSCSTAFAADPPSAKEMWKQIGVETELRNLSASVFFGGDVGSPDTYQKFFTDIEMYLSLIHI